MSLVKVRQPLYIDQPTTDFFGGELKSFDFMEGCTLGNMIAPQRASQIKYNDSFYMYIYNQNSPQKETLYKSVRLQLATIAINTGLNTWLIGNHNCSCGCEDTIFHTTLQGFFWQTQIKNSTSPWCFTELLFNSLFLSDPGKPLRPSNQNLRFEVDHKQKIPNTTKLPGVVLTRSLGTLQGENQATFKAAGSFSTTSSRLLSACPASSSTWTGL